MQIADDSLSHTFFALADPTRRAILDRLADGACPVGELAQPFTISAPAISRHLRILERSGLVVQEKDAQWRRCHLTADPLCEASDWLEHYRAFWEESFDALDAHLKRRQDRGTKHRTKRPSRRE